MATAAKATERPYEKVDDGDLNTMLRAANEDIATLRGTTSRRFPDQVLAQLDARIEEAEAVLAGRVQSVAYDVSRGGGNLEQIGAALVVAEHAEQIRTLVARFVESPAGHEMLQLREGTRVEYEARRRELEATIEALNLEVDLREAQRVYDRTYERIIG